MELEWSCVGENVEFHIAIPESSTRTRGILDVEFHFWISCSMEPVAFLSFYTVWDLLVEETNRYAHHRIHTTPPPRRGILSTWRDTCREEMMAFIGLILTMGIVQLPDIKDYWSTHQTLNLSFFR